MSENIAWGPEFRGSAEISKVLCGEQGDCNGWGDWENSLTSLAFSNFEYGYRLPADHWFYQHSLFTGEKPASKQSAPNSLRFEKCKRGFTLTEARMDYVLQPVYAFDKIEDLAEWLVEQYGD